jgi:DNA-binding MurR/RpiR family transcriptional regulator
MGGKTLTEKEYSAIKYMTNNFNDVVYLAKITKRNQTTISRIKRSTDYEDYRNIQRQLQVYGTNAKQTESKAVKNTATDVSLIAAIQENTDQLKLVVNLLSKAKRIRF